MSCYHFLTELIKLLKGGGVAIYHIYHIFERGGLGDLSHISQLLEGGGSGSFITVYHIGGGVSRRPKKL